MADVNNFDLPKLLLKIILYMVPMATRNQGRRIRKSNKTDDNQRNSWSGKYFEIKSQWSVNRLIRAAILSSGWKIRFDKGVNPAMQKIAGITTLPVIVIIKNGFYHILIEGFAGLRDAICLLYS